MLKRFPTIAMVVCFALLLGACKIPATGLPPQATLDQNAMYTQAVKTIVAEMTTTITPAESLPASTSTLEASLVPETMSRMRRREASRWKSSITGRR